MNPLKSFAVFLTLWCVQTSNLPGAEPTQANFEMFMAQHCVRCHNDKKQKGEFRIDDLSKDIVAGPHARKWAEVLEKISSGEMPPKEEKQPTPESATLMVEWLAAKLKEGEIARIAKREKVGFNKLSRAEYVNSIRDLLGVNYDAGDPTGIAEDDEWNGFARIGSVLSLSPSHIEKYLAAADMILAEAFPEKPIVRINKHKHALELRGNPADFSQPWGPKVRVDLWPGHEIQGGRPGPGTALPAAGDYKVRIQLSGLKPKNGPAPHLAFYASNLDRMLFEKDIIAAEDKPIVVEFTTHLPAGNHNFSLSNATPGPSNLPRSGRSDPRLPFFSIKEGRQPWQIKLTDDDGLPLHPFLILDWMEWEGPLNDTNPTFAQKEFLPRDIQGARESLAKFILRAFRRPAKSQDIEPLIKLIESELASGEKFEPAFKTALQAVLCSKNFLYLIEGDADKKDSKLNNWELASRLSYFIWSTMPDQALLDAARAGTLHQPDVLRSQLKRMLADPRSQSFSEHFPYEWLQLNMVGKFPPDKKLYPTYDAWLEKCMLNETTSFFREVLNNNLSLKEFLHSDWTMLNSKLADFYQIPGVDSNNFQRVALQPEHHRGGILTQASVLGLTSDGTRHRPVHRGKWVLESILGKSPPPPPANVPAIEPTPATQPKATLRNKLDAHKNNASCAGCHARIDPLGLAFDNYDAIGRWRLEEIVGDGIGENPKVNATGKLIDGRSFQNASDLKKLLLDDIDKFNIAFIEKLATFATRRIMTFDDRSAILELASQSKAGEYRVQRILESLVLSDLFQKR